MHTSSYATGNYSARTVENFSLPLDYTNFILTLTRTASLNATLANAHLHSKASWISICTVILPLDNITAWKLAVIKSFSHEHDLKKHVKSHSGEVHYCTRCDYSNLDERLLNQHMNKHLKIEKYFCKMCKKGFIYSNQLKCHYDKGC